MNFELKTLSLSAAVSYKCDLLVLLVPEGFKAQADALSSLVATAIRHGDLEPKPGKHLSLYAPAGIAARRLVLLGCGRGSAAAVRQAVQSLGAALKESAITRAALVFAMDCESGAVGAAVRAVAEAGYVYTATKSKAAKAEAASLSRVTVGVGDAGPVLREFATAVAVAMGVAYAREWANRPANHATPTLIAEAAVALSKHAGMRCKLHGPAQVAKLGMGAFLAVAQGSDQPLRFIELRYDGAASSAAPVVLVGKGITFDTGGISLKPAAEMDEMKFDMGGGASVLGVFRALAELKPSINVIGLIPACENMPDGKSVKPGDVVTSMSGQTIEILNTDAEGRLVLCDALTYASRFKPAAMIDIATLTRACVVALGGLRSGLFSSCDELAAGLVAAGDSAQDPCWRMPLDDDYADGLKSSFADVANVAGRAGGAITAAKFLQRFVGDTPWAHLDIAGTAWKGGSAKGATGRPVGLLVHYLLNQANEPSIKGKSPAARRARAA